MVSHALARGLCRVGKQASGAQRCVDRKPRSTTDTRKDGRSREPLCRLVFICFSLLPNRSEDVAAPDAKKPVFGEPNVFTFIDLFVWSVTRIVGREVQLPDKR